MADDSTIVIDEATLNRLKGEYETLLGDIETRLARYQWDTADPKSDLVLGEPFPLRLGGAEFDEAVGLAKALDAIRENIGDRVDNVYSNSYVLYWGLQFLLEDSEAVETLNSMTAEEFESFMPTESVTPDAESGTGT